MKLDECPTNIPQRLVNLFRSLPNQVLSHEFLWKQAWRQFDYSTMEPIAYDPKFCKPTIYANICYAKKLLTENECILTIWGRGYALKTKA